MKIITARCLVLILVILGALINLPAQSAKPTVYRDEKFPFSITYDSNEWEVVPSSYSDGRFRIASKSLMGLSEFNILVRKPPIAISEGQLIKLYTEAKADFLKGFTNANLPGTKILDSGTTYIASRRAVYIKNSYVMRNLDEEIELTTYQTISVYDGFFYVINFRAPSSLFDALFGDFRDLTSGFMFLPSPKAK